MFSERYVKFALLAWVVLSIVRASAHANERSSSGRDSESHGAISVRPFYSWQVGLSNETQAVVGPIEFERALKVRVDIPSVKILGIDDIAPNEVQSIGESSEAIKVCIVEGRCLTLALPRAGEVSDHSPELDFSDLLNTNGGKAYLSISRENPESSREISLSIMVETDHTFQLPQFDVVPDTGLSSVGSSDDERGIVIEDPSRIKTLDLHGAPVKFEGGVLPRNGKVSQ